MQPKHPAPDIKSWLTLLGLCLGLAMAAPGHAQAPQTEAGSQLSDTPEAETNQAAQPTPNRPRLMAENPYHRPERLIQGYRELQTIRREWDELARNRDDLLNRLQRTRGTYDTDDYSDNTILNRPVVDRLLARMHEQVGLENDLIEKAGRIVLMIGMASPSWEGVIRGDESTDLRIPELQRQTWLKALDALAEGDRGQFTQVLLGPRLGSAVTSRLSDRLWAEIEDDTTPLTLPNSPDMRRRWQERLRNMERRNRILRAQIEAQNEEIHLLYSLLSDDPMDTDDNLPEPDAGPVSRDALDSEASPDARSQATGPEPRTGE